ncbi:MAG: CPBP family glutamic-type intramembrane protease [Methanomicrobiales archaeon]
MDPKALNHFASIAKREVVLFLILTLGLSSVGWYLVTTAATGQEALIFTIFTMWCPGLAGIITRLAVQRNLRGFGFRWGESRWQVLAILLPVGLGLLMFGAVWLSGIAPFNTEKAAIIFSIPFVPAFTVALLFNLFSAAGEEIGWRGLLVPELSRLMNFTRLALLSGAIWTAWHFPLIIFGTYHGTGPLWYSLAVFVPSVMGAAVIIAWLRLVSGSVITAIFFHGFWNYFIQQFYPGLTVATPASEMILGEFGWAAMVVYVVLAIVFWHLRGMLPAPPGRSDG